MNRNLIPVRPIRRWFLGLTIIVSLSVFATAQRPLERPQTVAENFLRAMQVRDFEAARTYVSPYQQAEFALIVKWSQFSGWLAYESEPTDFLVLRSRRTQREMKIDYDLGEKGIAQIHLTVVDGKWFLDLAETSFQPLEAAEKLAIKPANSNRNPQDQAKRFLEALVRADFAQAARWGTPRTAGILRLLASLAPYGENRSGPIPEVVILSEEIDVNNASVSYRLGDLERTIELVRIGADWLVDLREADLSSVLPQQSK